jgi:hypothetical protein
VTGSLDGPSLPWWRLGGERFSPTRAAYSTQRAETRGAGHCAVRSGCVTHRSAALRIARITRFVATGYLRTNSVRLISTQQKYCDQGRSVVLLTREWPMPRAGNSCGSGAATRRASIFRSMNRSVGSSDGSVIQRMSFCGSRPTCLGVVSRRAHRPSRPSGRRYHECDCGRTVRSIRHGCRQRLSAERRHPPRR